MGIFQTDFLGEGYLGLFGYASEDYFLLSSRVSDQKVSEIEDCLGARPILTTIANFMLSGIMACGNSNGILIPYISGKREYEFLKKELEVSVISERYTALGNLVVANDYGAIVSDVFSDETKKLIEKTLKVEAKSTTVAGSSEVGSLCLATNKGFVLTPDASDEELKSLEELFQVPGGRASANMGSKAVGSCVIANAKGLVVGNKTTPIELEYLSEALGFV